jgi:hypothetical protein
MAVKITKTREGDVWRIRANGAATPFAIEKGPPPKYGYTQRHFLIHTRDDATVAEFKSVAAIMQLVADLANLEPAT